MAVNVKQILDLVDVLAYNVTGVLFVSKDCAELPADKWSGGGVVLHLVDPGCENLVAESLEGFGIKIYQIRMDSDRVILLDAKLHDDIICILDTAMKQRKQKEEQTRKNEELQNKVSQLERQISILKDDAVREKKPSQNVPSCTLYQSIDSVKQKFAVFRALIGKNYLRQ